MIWTEMSRSNLRAKLKKDYSIGGFHVTQVSLIITLVKNKIGAIQAHVTTA